MMVLSTTWPWAHTNMRHGLPCRSRVVSGLGNLNILKLSSCNKKPAFCGAGFRILIVGSGFYPPPPRPGFVAMMVLSTTWQWAHTNMRHGLPCRSRIASGLGNLNILNSGADDWISTSDLLLTGQVP